MKTVVSKTGVEVIYPCSVHLLSGEILECEYKSDQTGAELMGFICDHVGFPDKDLWGFTFLDCFEQRHWLELDKLIRTQVKNVCPIHLLFRVKVYPPEPYKLEEPTKSHIFLQLRLDLKSGRLCCGMSDAALLLGLIIQYQLGDYNTEVHFGNYIKKKHLQHQNFTIEMKAITFHKDHLTGISKDQTIDLFLRLASQLETYGVDPFLVEDSEKKTLTLWVNHKGMDTYIDAERIHHLEWMAISRIKQDECLLQVYLTSGDIVDFLCLTKGECSYIYETTVDHLRYFTSSVTKSTTGIIGSESTEDIEEEEISSIDMNDFTEVTPEAPEPEIEMDLPRPVEKTEIELKKKFWLNLFPNKIKNWQVAMIGIFLALCLELYFFDDRGSLSQQEIKQLWQSVVKNYWDK